VGIGVEVEFLFSLSFRQKNPFFPLSSISIELDQGLNGFSLFSRAGKTSPIFCAAADDVWVSPSSM